MRALRASAHVASVIVILLYIVLAGTCDFLRLGSVLPNFLPERWSTLQRAMFLVGPGALGGAVVYALVCLRKGKRLMPLGALLYGVAGALVVHLFLFRSWSGSQDGPAVGWMVAVLMGAIGNPSVAALMVLLGAWGLAALASWIRERRAQLRTPQQTSV